MWQGSREEKEDLSLSSLHYSTVAAAATLRLQAADTLKGGRGFVLMIWTKLP